MGDAAIPHADQNYPLIPVRAFIRVFGHSNLLGLVKHNGMPNSALLVTFVILEKGLKIAAIVKSVTVRIAIARVLGKLLRNCSVLAIRPADSQSLKKLSKRFSCHLSIIACRAGLNSMPASISGSFSVGDLLANFESKIDILRGATNIRVQADSMVATVQD